MWTYWQLRRTVKRNKMLDPEFEPGLRNRESMIEDFDDNGDVIETAVTCLVLGNGAGLPMCSIEHLSEYAVRHGRELGAIRIGQSKARAAYCSHCYWCGTIIRRPERCVVHATGKCPSFMWERSEFAREVYSEFHFAHDRMPTEFELKKIRFLARAHPELTTREIVNQFDID